MSPTPRSIRLAPGLRTALVVAVSTAGFVTLVATGGGGGDSSAPAQGPTTVGGASCAIGVRAGFAGDLEWTSADGTVGTGADGQGGVGIGAAVSIASIRGAAVTVKGPDGAVLGSAATGADGRATFTSCGAAGPFLVEVTGQAGATYFDEARGAAGEDVPFGAGETLRAYVPSLVRNVGVTPLTEIAARRLVAAGTPIDAGAVTAANERVRRELAPSTLVDDVARMPASGGTGTPGGSALADTPASRHALLLGAFGRLAITFNPTLAAPALDAARQLALDAADGTVDGNDAAGAPIAPIGARAYEPARLIAAIDAALPTVARRHADATLLARLPAVTALGAVGLPNAQGVAVPAATRLRASGTLSTIAAAGGADATQLATDVAELSMASQQPPTALFLRGPDAAQRAVGFDGPAGLLGVGTTGGSTTPVASPALRGAGSIGVGLEHALARLADGSVVGWGSAARRQLAGTAATRVPQPVVEVRGAISVLAIADLSFALLADGTVPSWGTGAGAIGGGGTSIVAKQAPSPVLTAPDTPLRNVMALAGYVGTSGTPDATLAALRTDGSVWTWGDNATGGLGAAGPSRGFAQPVAGLARIVRVVASGNGFFALDRDGAAFFWGRPAAAAGAPVPAALVPTRLEGLPPIRDLAGAVQGLYQARLVTSDGQRYRADGVDAAQVTEATELDVRAPAPGIVTIGTIAGDDRVNAAERSAGLAVSGTVSQPNRPVTVRLGGATRSVTASGTAWSTSFAAADVPASGAFDVVATFVTTTGATSGEGRRSVQVDAVAPTVAISDDMPGNATGPITFTFTWSEAVTGFAANDVVVSLAGATKGALQQISASVYRMTITTPAGASGSLTVSVPAGAAADLIGNANATDQVSAPQPLADTVPPTLLIENETPQMPSAGANTYPVQQGIRANFKFTWSEPVNGFAADDVEVTNGGAKGPLVAVQGQPNVYRMSVDLPFDQLVTVATVRAGRVTDGGGNANPTAVSLQSPNGGTFDQSYDAASPGVGGGADGGGASGDGGNPGNPPNPFAVTTARVGTSSLRLSWTKSTNPADGPIVYYQIIRNQGTATRTGMILRPWGNPLPAVWASYTVTVPVPSSGTVYYRIRACNTRPPADGQPPLTGGYTGCRDSQEFIAGGATTGQANNFCPRIRAQADVYPQFILDDFPSAPYVTAVQCSGF